mmetsp:Transcript_139449/g.253662  ORF Transcript_139449/g.253662 Transcript_139449/m.253662 type:complete len:89 (+) Transcript_139449:424-690(+)
MMPVQSLSCCQLAAVLEVRASAGQVSASLMPDLRTQDRAGIQLQAKPQVSNAAQTQVFRTAVWQAAICAGFQDLLMARVSPCSWCAQL